ELITYNVLPISSNSGIIEMVEDCDTIYYIEEKMKSTILNYILEFNEDKKIGFIRMKFAKSLAAFSVISYLFGIGDRHLDNIMISKDGRIFHIDFGYILGEDPVISNPGIRITENMIETLGGIDSK